MPHVIDKRGLERHHDMVLQFERNFLKTGYDPDTVGRWLSKADHRKLHMGKGYGHGGAFNYQWMRFFKGGEFSNLNGDEIRFNIESDFGPQFQKVLDFLDVLREECKKDIPNWPFLPTE